VASSRRPAPSIAVKEDAAWRQKALERSLRTARARAESRSEQFIQAGTSLLFETGSTEFTVQELMERSGLSLRSFYQHFASKDDLVLAVFEEALARYVTALRSTLASYRDPVERLQAYVMGFYAAGDGQHVPVSQALSKYLLRLTQTGPSELARVLEPQTTLLLEIVQEGVASGRIRGDVAAERLTLMITQTLMSAVQMNVLGTYLTGEGLTADELWAFCARGALAQPAGRARSVSPRG
jgi:AcrR family transcriptional regulator